MNPDQVFAEIQELARGIRSGPWQPHAQQLLGMAKCWWQSNRENGEDLLETPVTGDFGDRGDANARRFDDHAKSGLAQAQLVQIQRALRRIQQGIYRICETCGEDIPPERLRAVPDATRCVPCRKASRSSR